MKNIFCSFTILLFVLSSCIEKTQLGLLCKSPTKENIPINYRLLLDSNLDSTQYELIDVVELQLPKDLGFYASPISIMNDSTIVILDKEVHNQILSFDMTGKFLGKLGRIGHAKNEYIKVPNSISFDENGHIHAFSRANMRLYKFDRYGKLLNTHKVETCPSGTSVIGNDKYLFAYDYQEENHKSRLSLYDCLHEKMTTLMYIPKEEHKIEYFCAFSQNEKETYFVPMLTDSVIVFEGEKVKKIIHLEFNGKFFPQDLRNEALSDKGLELVYNRQGGVNVINNFSASNKYYLVKYIYNDDGYPQRGASLIDRYTGKIIFNSLNFLLGVNPYSNYNIYKDFIYFIVDEDIVKYINEQYPKNQFPEIWKSTPYAIRNLMNDEAKLPALVRIRLK